MVSKGSVLAFHDPNFSVDTVSKANETQTLIEILMRLIAKG